MDAGSGKAVNLEVTFIKIYYVFILMCELFCNLPRGQGTYFTQVVPKSQRGGAELTKYVHFWIPS